MKSSLLSRLAIAALAFGLVGSSTVLEARTRSSARQTNRHRGDANRTTTWTNAQGQTGTHTFRRDVDPATRSVTKDTATTLPDGRTAGRHLESVKTDTGRETTGTATGFNGRTATLQSTTTRTDNGFSRDAVVTAPNGKTATTDVDVVRENGTATRTVTRTGFNGATSTKTQTNTRSVTPPPAPGS